MVSKRKLVSISALVIAVIFLVSVVGKLFFPVEGKEAFYFAVAGIELGLLGLLLFFFNKRVIWLLLTLIFSAWGGYAFFAMRANIPCGCMGKMIELPAIVMFSLDLLLWGSSLVISYLLKENKKVLGCMLALSIVMALIGYSLAAWMSPLA